MRATSSDAGSATSAAPVAIARWRRLSSRSRSSSRSSASTRAAASTSECWSSYSPSCMSTTSTQRRRKLFEAEIGDLEIWRFGDLEGFGDLGFEYLLSDSGFRHCSIGDVNLG